MLLITDDGVVVEGNGCQEGGVLEIMDMMVVLTEIQWQTLTVVTFIWKIRGERLGIRSGPDQIF